MIKRHCSLDNPFFNEEVGRVFRCSGWDLQNTNEIGVAINGLPLFSLSRSFREDLRNAFPSNGRAVTCGFYGDVVLPDSSENKVELTLIENVDDVWKPFHSVYIDVKQQAEQMLPDRKRNYCINDILAWPGGESIEGFESRKLVGRENKQQRNGVETYSINGIPHFHNENTLPLIRVSEQATTHPHSKRAKTIIDAAGLVLDLGAGIPDPDHIPPNMVLTDAVHSPNLDVVNTCGSLPFKDNTFDAVISQAVFEHVRNPFLMAREVHRILKPGGIFYLTTAFMQPLHGDPSHYYNMTMNGLKDVLADFDIEEIGLEPSQQPSYGIQMAIEAVLPYMTSGNMKDAIEFAHEFIVSNRSQFDNALGPVGRETLAAGFYAVGRKISK